jgi:hypothetical protein
MGISLFSFGEFSHFFNLKNMASTNTKDFCERKNGPNFPEFFYFYIFVARFLHQFPVSSQNIRGSLKIFYFHVGYIAKFG